MPSLDLMTDLGKRYIFHTFQWKTGLCVMMSKWAMDDHFPIKWRANEQQGEGWAPTRKSNKDFLTNKSTEHVPLENPRKSPRVCPLFAGQWAADSPQWRGGAESSVISAPPSDVVVEGGGFRRIWKTRELFTPKWWVVWCLLDSYYVIIPRLPNTSWEGVSGMFLGSKYLLTRCLEA